MYKDYATACTDTSKLIHLLEMLGKEAKLERGRLPSEETDYVHEGPMDEYTTHVLQADSWGMEKGFTAVDGIVILHKIKFNALQTVVGLDLSFNELMLSTTREYDEIMLVLDKYKDVYL